MNKRTLATVTYCIYTILVKEKKKRYLEKIIINQSINQSIHQSYKNI